MWLDNLKKMKEESKLTTKEISLQSGIPEPTLEKLFAGTTKDPKLNTLQQLVHFFGRTLDDLNDYSSPQSIKKAPSLTGEALKVARDYDGLDDHGQRMTQLVISEEQKRMNEEAKTAETPTTIIPFTPKKKTTHRGIVTLEVYEEPSAAGTGNYVSDAPASHMEQYPEEKIPSYTDFGVVISGRSMAPKYPDQSVVFVKSTQVVEPGEIGIFLLDGQTYIKQLKVEPETGDVSLHSLNPEYKDVKVSPFADFRSLGKVLGGYDPATRKMIWK